jgi:hypothetical protein
MLDGVGDDSVHEPNRQGVFFQIGASLSLGLPHTHDQHNEGEDEERDLGYQGTKECPLGHVSAEVSCLEIAEEVIVEAVTGMGAAQESKTHYVYHGLPNTLMARVMVVLTTFATIGYQQIF